MESELIFNLSYFLICFCIIYPPKEFVSAGITIPAIFSRCLGSESESFVRYHLKRTTLSLLIYSLLPLGYITLLCLSGFVNEVNSLFLESNSLIWKIFFTLSITFPVTALIIIKIWIENDFEKHPIACSISKFCNNNTQWKSVASNIDIEFRRIDKIVVNSGTLYKVVATENWIMKVCPLTIYVMHQSDSSLQVINADTHPIALDSISEVQYLNIEVKSSRPSVNPFIIRINATDFRDLQDRFARSITISPEVKFHKTIIEKFIDVFKDIVKSNEKYEYDQEVENCIGCFQVKSNVKIQKLCEDTPNGNDNCSVCYCRPMWCVECLAKWFASRQDNEQRETWLKSKCSCPMCRAKFCLLDVCYLNTEEEEEDNIENVNS